MKLKVIIGIALLLAIIVVSCQNGHSIEFDRYYSSGSLVYETRCQNCHGAKGEGLQALVPALTDSVFIKKKLHALPCLVKNGLRGKVTINNRDFAEKMGAIDLAPIEIANVLTYVANSFGNKCGTINVEQVQNDLSNCK